MSEQAFQQLISGQTTGFFAAICRGMLWSLSMPYGLITRLRNACFDVGVKKVRRVGVPVIAIGNLTTGGTGKTPIVATVVQLLQELGYQPGIVSRGYRADASGENDEKRVLKKLCPGVPHEQNPNRVVAAKTLIDSEKVDVIVLDDALQHRRIHRDLNVVLIDATNPFGFGYQLPRGLLRESLSGLNRADLVLITRANAASPTKLGQIETAILQHNAELAGNIHRVSFLPTGLLSADGGVQPLTAAQNKPATILTAIGNPGAFVSTCRQFGVNIATSMFFADHHHYTEEDLRQVQLHAEAAQAPLILTTLKDLVKIPPGNTNILAVQIQTVFEDASSLQSVREKLLKIVDAR
jgi:tetraacyldisaccharide 4'-kinase